jgi:hypothetical protein
MVMIVPAEISQGMRQNYYVDTDKNVGIADWLLNQDIQCRLQQKY